LNKNNLNVHLESSFFIKVFNEKESLEDSHRILEEELKDSKTSLDQLKQQMAEQTSELETLRSCLLQVTQEDKGVVKFGAETGSNGAEEEEEERAGLTDGDEGENEEDGKTEDTEKRKAQLMRIEALLNTTKVRCNSSSVSGQIYFYFYFLSFIR